MTKATKELLEKFKALSRKERLSLLREIDEFELEAAPIPDWQKKALEEALDDERKNPDEGEDWDHVYKRLMSRYSRPGLQRAVSEAARQDKRASSSRP
ncbi:MAG: hypothetical protein IT461_07735 [Planctomycetes bacterium]|nr:hypothetical protein [Planctomycetota bacterium]